MEKVLDTDEMVLMIKFLLSTCTNGAYIMESVTDRMTIKFTGDRHEVQSEVLKWLSVPERLKNIQIMEDFRKENIELICPDCGSIKKVTKENYNYICPNCTGNMIKR